MKPAMIAPKFRQWAVQHGTPWEVSFPRRGAVPGRRRFFATMTEATDAITEWTAGDASAGLPKRVVDEVLYVRSLLPEGVTLTDLYRFYAQHHAGLTVATVQVVADAYLRDCQRANEEKYYSEQKRVIDLLVTELGADVLFSSLSRARLVETIKAPDSYWNRYARKRAVRCLITKAIELDAVKVDPLAGWKFEDAPKATPHTLSTETAQAIMEHVFHERHELVPAFALQLFAGIRTEELCRETADGRRPLDWKDITFGAKIDVPAEVSKTGDRRVIDFWPEALTNWLRAWHPTGTMREGKVCPIANLEDAKSKLLSGFPEFKQNDFRRTYASNAYALHGARVQDWMGHTDGRMLKRHYKDFIEPAKAQAYFASKAPEVAANVVPMAV